MGPGAESPESEQSLRQVPCNDGSGHLEIVGKPEPRRRKCRKCNYKKCTFVLAVALAVMFLGLLITVIALAGLCPWAGPCCPDGWIGYRGKCYYFSEREGNWTYSQSHCSALNTSLAGIDSEQEMGFMLRYKGRFDHWIGLWRDPGQPWKWANGTEFNNLFMIRGYGDCAYLTDEYGVSSSRCTSERYWICTKPDAFTWAKENVVEGADKKSSVETSPGKA